MTELSGDGAWESLPASALPAQVNSAAGSTAQRAFDYYYSNYYQAVSPITGSSSSLLRAPHIIDRVNQTLDNVNNFSTTILFISANSTTLFDDVENGTTAATALRQHLCTTEDKTWMDWERATLLTCGLSGAVIIAVLNLCVIITFIKCAELRTAPQNLYILNLAICDFCVGVNSLPGVTIYFFNMCWPFSVPLCQMMTNIDWITSTETGISMCLVAFDRLQLVRLGALYGTLENRSVVAKKIIISWLFVIGLLTPGFLMPLYTGVSVNEYGDCMNEIYQIETLGTALYTFTGTLPPLMLAIIYVMVYREMRANVRFNNEREARRQRRAASGMYFLCVVFMASWIPPTIHEVFVALIHNIPALQTIRLDERVEFRIMTFFKFWVYLNSLVNPFLYASAFPAIRSAMEKTFLPTKWHRHLDAQRRSQRSKIDNGSDDQGSMRTIRTLASLSLRPMGNTILRIVRPSSARSATTSDNSNNATDQVNNSNSVNPAVRKTHSVPSPGMQKRSPNGTLLNATGSPAMANGKSPSTLKVPLDNNNNNNVMLLLDDGETTTTTRTTGGSSSSGGSGLHNNQTNYNSITNKKHSSPSVCSAPTTKLHVNHLQQVTDRKSTAMLANILHGRHFDKCMNGQIPAAAVRPDDIELMSIKSGMTETVAEVVTTSPEEEATPEEINMSGERMLIVTPHGELLLRTVVVNGYTTVML